MVGIRDTLAGMCTGLTHPLRSLQGPQSRLKTIPAAFEASCGHSSSVLDKWNRVGDQLHCERVQHVQGPVKTSNELRDARPCPVDKGASGVLEAATDCPAGSA